MTAFSSWGPTDDGRIKPDLVANGQAVFSSEEGFDSDYGVQSGTSMAAPNVTGTAALLLEHYRDLHDDEDPTSATLKGVLIHTASDAGNVGPDYRHGWGLVNAAEAAEFLTESADTLRETRLAPRTDEHSESFLTRRISIRRASRTCA
jgi:subtilisin family serine protease